MQHAGKLEPAAKGYAGDFASEEPMAEDKKKTKIDLKARLGKSSMSMTGTPGAAPVPLPTPGVQPGGSDAPPPADGSAPAVAGSTPPAAPLRSTGSRPALGIAPPPGISPGIPVPPFAQQQKAAPAPKPTAAQTTIKVEVGEEIHAERKKAAKRMALYATLTALLGAGLGWVGGGAKARSDQGQAAVRIAGELEKDVKAANEKMKELADKLTAATEQLGNKQYPAEVVKELGGINVPFDSMLLGTRNAGLLPPKYFKPILRYTSAVEDLNESKQSLQNLMGAAQAPIEKVWKEEKEPVVSFSVIFAPDGAKGMAAELVTNKEPFPIGKEWPANYTILRPERTQQGMKMAEKKATRWVKGELTGTDPVAIPVQPSSVAAFTSEELVFKLGKAIRDLRQKLEGNKDNPTDETAGLLKEGEDLANELRKAALAR